MLICDHISNFNKYALSILSIYSTLIDIVLRDYNAALLCNFLFLLTPWLGE